jgi:hypothetical protein
MKLQAAAIAAMSLVAAIAFAQSEPRDGGPWVQAAARPVHTQRVAVPSAARGDFLASLERFAKDNGFEYAGRATTPHQTLFLLEMERRDARMIASNATDQNAFRIYYYHGEQPLQDHALATLTSRLRAALPPNTSLQGGPAQAPAPGRPR